MSPHITLQFLGPPQIHLDDAPIFPERRTVIALLAYLALNPQRHSREFLSSLFWSKYNQTKAFTNLRHTLWEVHKSIGEDWIISDRATVSLNQAADISSDVMRFQDSLYKARHQTDLTLRTALLVDTVSIYRNHFLTGFSLRDAPEFNEWIFTQSESLRNDLASALTLIVDSYLAQTQAESTIQHARRLISLNPLNESAHRQMMEVYLQAGQYTAALKQYQTCEQILRKELGIDPQPETLALYKKIRKHEIKPANTTHPVQAKTPKHNLPLQLTTFIGREKERDEVCNLLNKNRFVTLVGAGGIGKTRLALQVGEKLLSEYFDGVWFIPLDVLTDAALVPQAVASVFGIKNIADHTIMERLINVLHDQTTLLIFDNCEHLLESTRDLIETLLKNCPKIKVLATSREVLGIDGEAVYQVPSLPIPQIITAHQLEDFESIQLFSERAGLAFHKFSLTQENIEAVAGICQRVDGIPLAIELASARVDILTLEEILEQLNKSFALLTHRGHAPVARHQSMRASMDWSWNLLTEKEQTLLSRLSVFSGGWTLEAAQSVCVDETLLAETILELTSSLAKKSLLIVEQVERHITHYRFHEIVRQYAREKLVDECPIRTRHMQYYRQVSEKIEVALRGPQPGECLDLIHIEHGNLFAALEWAVKTDVETGLHIASNLKHYWEMMDIFGGEAWLGQLLEKDESSLYPRARARALCIRTALLTLMVKPEQASECAAEGLKLYETLGNPIGEIDGLLSVSLATGSGDHLKKALEKAKALGDTERQAKVYVRLAWGGGRRENRRLYLEKALSLLRDSGNLIQIAGMLIDLAAIDYSEGQYELALKEFEDFIEKDKSLTAEYFKTNDLRTIFARATISLIKGNYEQSRIGYEQCAQVLEKVGDRYDGSWLHARAGHAAVLEGDFPAARSIFTEATYGFQNINSENGLAFTLEGMANLCVRTGKYEQAAHLIGFADAARKRVGDNRPHGEQADVDRIISACLLKIGEETFSDAYDEGQKMKMDEAVALVLEES